jgi:Rrf2 family iron-sulfur cluster assembly transcriptional regulator
MNLSTKGRYAVTAIVDLALRSADGPVALAEISERQGISLSYLEQLFAALRRRGLVTGLRGPGGGYRLGRAPSQITVADVVTAVDDAEGTRATLATHSGSDPCLTHELWRDLSAQIRDVLDGITLETLMQRPSVSEVGHGRVDPQAG